MRHRGRPRNESPYYAVRGCSRSRRPAIRTIAGTGAGPRVSDGVAPVRCVGKSGRHATSSPRRRVEATGFTSTDEANDALQEALKQRKQNEKFGNKVPTVGTYADEWVAGLKLAASTITGYKKIIRNHIRPQLGTIRLDKLTATRIARHYRDLEDHGRRDEYSKGQPLSANSGPRCTSCSARSSTLR